MAVLWDAGLSRAEGDKSRELKLLERLLKQWPGAAADLVVFRDAAEPPATFDLSAADGRGQIIETLSHVAYDGASDLAHLPLPRDVRGFPGYADPVGKRVDPVAYDLILLFTDGLGGAGPADHGEGGGAGVRLQRRAADQPRPAAAGLPRERRRLLQPRPLRRRAGAGGGGAGAVRAGVGGLQGGRGGGGLPRRGGTRPRGRSGGGHRAAAGPRGDDHSELRLRKAGHPQRAVHRSRRADAAAGELVPRYWAQQKVAELSLRPDANDEELAKVGKQFNLVTPNTSLLVLETAEQYVQYRVVPPRTQPEVYKQFLARIEQNKAQERQTREQKLQQVLAMWDGRVKWWEQQYNYPKDLKYAQPEESKAGLLALERSEVRAVVPRNGSAAAPVPPATPSPIPEPAPVSAEAASTTPAPAAAPLEAARHALQVPGGRGPGGAGPAGPAAPARPVAPALEQTVQAAREVMDADGTAAELKKDAKLSPVSGGVAGEAGRRVYNTTDLAINVPDFTDAPKFDLATGSGRGRGTFGNSDALGSATSIAIKPWDPSTPYLSAMKAAGPQRAYAAFLEQRKTFGASPAFYLDCGDYLQRVGQHAMAVRVLGDVAALRLADARAAARGRPPPGATGRAGAGDRAVRGGAADAAGGAAEPPRPGAGPGRPGGRAGGPAQGRPPPRQRQGRLRTTPAAWTC